MDQIVEVVVGPHVWLQACVSATSGAAASAVLDIAIINARMSTRQKVLFIMIAILSFSYSALKSVLGESP